MEKFLELLFGGISNDQFIELRCLPVTKGAKPMQYYFGKSDIDSLSNLAIALDNQHIYHVCVGVLPRNQQKGIASAVDTLQAFWIDIDAKDVSMGDLFRHIDKFPIQPTVVVNSGHGYHCYWVLESPFKGSHEEIKILASRLHHITHADKTFDASRVLRLPGTTNCKDPDKLLPCKVVRRTDNRVELKDMLNWMDAAEAEAEELAELQIKEHSLLKPSARPAVDGEKKIRPERYHFETWEDLKIYLSAFLVKRIKEMPLHLRDEHGQKLDRSKNDFYVATSLLELGFTEEQVCKAFEIFAQHGFAAGQKIKEKGIGYAIDYTVPNASKQVPYNIHELLELLESPTGDEMQGLAYMERALQIVRNTRAEIYLKRLGSIAMHNLAMDKGTFASFAKRVISGKGAYAFENCEVFKKSTIMHKKVAETIIMDNPYACIGTEIYRYENGIYVKDENLQKLAAHVWAISENRPAGSILGQDYMCPAEDTWLDLKQRDINEISQYIVQNAPQIDLTEELVEPNLICVNNGMVNWKTGELKPWSPKYKRLAKLDVSYNAPATSKVLDTFVAETFHKSDIRTMWEFMGVTILESLTAKKFMILVGGGDNGKSVWLNAVRKILGGDNVSSAKLSDLANNRFTKAQLLGKLANIASDISGNALEDISNIKELTGNDQTSADRKFQSAVSFVNKAALIFSCNVLPEATSADDAYFRRLMIIECPNQVPEEKQDRFLEEKLTTDLSRSAWLNRAIEGLKRYHDNQLIFTGSPKIAELVESHKNDCRPDISFVERYIMQSGDHGVLTIEELCRELKTWINSTSLVEMPPKSVVKSLMFKKYPKNPLRSNDMGIPGFVGLKLNKSQMKKDLGISGFSVRLKN